MRVALAQRSAEVDPAAVGQSHVEHGDIHLAHVEGERGLERPGLLGDHQVGVGLEELAQTPANDLVIVNE